MPNYGDIVYSVKQIWVAALEDETGSYGTPAYIEYPQDGGYEPQHDNDAIKAGGATVELLSVLTGAKVTLKEASMRDDAINIIEGATATVSGASGNRVSKRPAVAGGAGLPYFGMVQVFNATNGAVYVVGFAKCKAETKQKFMAEQNKFRVGEMVINVAATPIPYKVFLPVKYENEEDVPDFSDATEFENFLAELWS